MVVGTVLVEGMSTATEQDALKLARGYHVRRIVNGPISGHNRGYRDSLATGTRWRFRRRSNPCVARYRSHRDNS